MNEGHKKLHIYQEAHAVAIRIHTMTLNLPAHERFEEGSQTDLNNFCGKIFRYIQAVDKNFDKPNFMNAPLSQTSNPKPAKNSDIS